MPTASKTDVAAAAVHAVMSRLEFEGRRPMQPAQPNRVSLIDVIFPTNEEHPYINRIKVRGFFASHVPAVETMIAPDDGENFDTLAVVRFSENWTPHIEFHDVDKLVERRKYSNRSQTLRTLQEIQSESNSDDYTRGYNRALADVKGIAIESVTIGGKHAVDNSASAE